MMGGDSISSGEGDDASGCVEVESLGYKKTHIKLITMQRSKNPVTTPKEIVLERGHSTPNHLRGKHCLVKLF